MKELISEDLFDQIDKADVICITTNCTISDDGSNPMGGGCAGMAARRWPEIEDRYGELLSIVGHVPVILGILYQDNPTYVHSLSSAPTLDPKYKFTYLVAYPTMHSIMERASLSLVARSAHLLSEMADTNGWTKVVVPRPGVGVGSLSWEDVVKPLIENILDDRFILIHKEFSPPKASMTWNSTMFNEKDDNDN